MEIRRLYAELDTIRRAIRSSSSSSGSSGSESESGSESDSSSEGESPGLVQTIKFRGRKYEMK
tara:strand:+ start:265 stop:453 length:189 start_codon:yes stop_codon:yes gene_type:complete